jgi:hypothetical protein
MRSLKVCGGRVINSREVSIPASTTVAVPSG